MAKETNPALPDSLVKDLLLLEFKEWFKTDFFKWVDTPKCDRWVKAFIDVGSFQNNILFFSLFERISGIE